MRLTGYDAVTTGVVFTVTLELFHTAIATTIVWSSRARYFVPLPQSTLSTLRVKKNEVAGKSNEKIELKRKEEHRKNIINLIKGSMSCFNAVTIENLGFNSYDVPAVEQSRKMLGVPQVMRSSSLGSVVSKTNPFLQG